MYKYTCLDHDPYISPSCTQTILQARASDFKFRVCPLAFRSDMAMHAYSFELNGQNDDDLSKGEGTPEGSDIVPQPIDAGMMRESNRLFKYGSFADCVFTGYGRQQANHAG